MALDGGVRWDNGGFRGERDKTARGVGWDMAILAITYLSFVRRGMIQFRSSSGSCVRTTNKACRHLSAENSTNYCGEVCKVFYM